MSTEQPAASSSKTPLPARHLCALVFDSSTLSRQAFVRLSGTDSIVSRLVQRLQDKYEGEDKIRVAAYISQPQSATCSRSPRPVMHDFVAPAAFLSALPKYAAHFSQQGSGKITQVPWPALSDDGDGDTPPVLDDSPGNLGALPAAIAGGLQMLDLPAHLASPIFPPTSWTSLTPPSGQPILNDLYTPPPGLHKYSPSQKRYLVILSGGSESSESVASAPGGWDTALDRSTWDSLAEAARARGVICSSVILGSFKQPNRLQAFCQTASGNADNSWLSLPPDISVHLCDFTIDQDPVSAPELAPSVPEPTMPTLDNPTSSLSTAQKQQLLVQQQALRMIQLQAARGAVDGKAPPPISPAVLQNIMTAAKNGQIDLNNPALQQFRHLIMLHQQQRQALASSNANVTATNTTNPASITASAVSTFTSGGVGNVVAQNMEQMIQEAVKQQQINQQQTSYAQKQPGTTSASNPNQTTGEANRPIKIWTGDLSWEMPHSGQTSIFKVALDAYPFSGSSPDFQLTQWSARLKVASMPQMTLPELQAYARQNRTPVVLFQSAVASDTANAARYQSLVAILHSKGNMAVVPFMQPDRGILLFTAPGGNTPKLLGAVCFNVPLPPQARTQPQAPQTQTTTQLPQLTNSNLAAQQLQQLQAAQQVLTHQQQGQLHQPTFPSNFQPQQPQQQQQQQQQQAQKNTFQQQPNQFIQSFKQPSQTVSIQPNQQGFQYGQNNSGMQNSMGANRSMSQFPQQMAGGLGAAPKLTIDARAANAIRNMAITYNINLPPNFDPNNIAPDKLQAILRLIKQAEINAKAQQQQQQQLGQQQRSMQPNQMGGMGGVGGMGGMGGMSGMGGMNAGMGMMGGQGQNQNQMGQPGQFGMNGVNLNAIGLQMPNQGAQGNQGIQGLPGINPQMFNNLGMSMSGQQQYMPQ